MISLTLKELVRPFELIQIVLWVVFTLSILIYVGVVYFIASQPSSSAHGIDDFLRNILTGAAVVVGVASIFLRRHFLSDQRLQAFQAGQVDVQQLAKNPQTGQIDEAKRAKLESLNSAELNAFGVATYSFTPFLICLTFNEAVVIFGLVIAFLAREPAIIIPFAAAAIVLNVVMFPRLEPLIERSMGTSRVF